MERLTPEERGLIVEALRFYAEEFLPDDGGDEATRLADMLEAL